MAGKRELILVFAADVIFVRDVFRGLAVVDQRVELGHPLVGKAPAERAVIHLHVAALKRARRFAHYPRASRHALDAAGDEQIAVVGLDGAAGLVDRFESGTAQAVHRRPRDRVGQAGEQGSIARDIARVFAGLVGTAEINVFDFIFVDAGLFNHLGDDIRGEIIGADIFQYAAVASHWRAHSFDDYGFSHGFT